MPLAKLSFLLALKLFFIALKKPQTVSRKIEVMLFGRQEGKRNMNYFDSSLLERFKVKEKSWRAGYLRPEILKQK